MPYPQVKRDAVFPGTLGPAGEPAGAAGSWTASERAAAKWQNAELTLCRGAARCSREAQA